MTESIEIKSLQDEGIELFASMTEAQLRRRLEQEKGIFIAESPKVIRTALAAGCQPLALLMEKRHIEGQAADIIAACPDTPLYTGERQILAQLTGFELTRGVLCAMQRPSPKDIKKLLSEARRIVVLESICDSTNIGAIFRSAAALGMDALLLSEDCCDPLCRRALRVSMGTVLQLPWCYIKEWSGSGIAQLHELGFITAAMALDEHAIPLDEARLKAEKLAIVLGTEGDGLAKQTVSACDCCLRIPMAHGVDSLNVAAASAIAFWQLCRQ